MLDRKHFKCVQTLICMHPLPWTADDWKSRLYDFHCPGPNWVRDIILQLHDESVQVVREVTPGHVINDINMSRCHFPNHLNWIIMQLQHDNRPPCHVISILPTPTPTPTCIWVREWAVIGNFVVKTQHCLVVCGIPVLSAACIVLDSGTVKPCDGLVGYHMSFGIFAASAPWIC